MDFEYKIFCAPSPWTIDKAAELGFNAVIVHSCGLTGEYHMRDPATGAERDMYPIYFDAYPRVAKLRHTRDKVWLEELRKEVTALCLRAHDQGLKVVFHVYEPTLPMTFEKEYPDLFPVWRRPTESGSLTVHGNMDPDNPATWDVLRCKYAEFAKDFPMLDMVVITTWDGAGSYWCVPKAKMPVPDRLVKTVLTAREGVASVRKGVTVCFRLWGRNWPRAMYMDSHRLIREIAGVKNAEEVMQPVAKPANDPDAILPKVFAGLPPDVPIMYKSTRIDIAESQPLSMALGTYPRERKQIMEVSYECAHLTPWPWCMIRHIRTGFEAAKANKLYGIVALPVNMGCDDRTMNPDEGNLGRMNTWLLKRMLDKPAESNETLVAAWLEKEFGAPQPKEAVEALLDAEGIVDRGINWGNGVPSRIQFGTPHVVKLLWFYEGFVDKEFPYKMAAPTREIIEGLMKMKKDAYEEACRGLEKIKATRAAMSQRLYDELVAGYTLLSDYILLCRDWQCYLLMLYGIERGVYPADRVHLETMSRYAETFIHNLCRLKDTDAGKRAMKRLGFPEPFPIE